MGLWTAVEGTAYGQHSHLNCFQDHLVVLYERSIGGLGRKGYSTCGAITYMCMCMCMVTRGCGKCQAQGAVEREASHTTGPAVEDSHTQSLSQSPQPLTGPNSKEGPHDIQDCPACWIQVCERRFSLCNPTGRLLPPLSLSLSPSFTTKPNVR